MQIICSHLHAKDQSSIDEKNIFSPEKANLYQLRQLASKPSFIESPARYKQPNPNLQTCLLNRMFERLGRPSRLPLYRECLLWSVQSDPLHPI